jgi:hypothetical protein
MPDQGQQLTQKKRKQHWDRCQNYKPEQLKDVLTFKLPKDVVASFVATVEPRKVLSSPQFRLDPESHSNQTTCMVLYAPKQDQGPNQGAVSETRHQHDNEYRHNNGLNQLNHR